MPVTAAQLQELGKTATSLWLKNDPIDQISKERPLLKCLFNNKKPTGMGSDFIIVTLRKDYQSNFQWYYGDDTVTYNRRDSLEQAKFDYGSVHDGFTAHEDDFVRAGLIISDDQREPVTSTEKVIIRDFFKERMEILKEGFEEKLDYELHLDGTQDADAVTGLDGMITLNGQGTYGSIDSAAAGNAYWQNNFDLTLTEATMLEKMELQYTAMTKFKGRLSKILMGADAYAMYRKVSNSTIQRHVTVSTAGQSVSVDGGTEDLKFRGVPVMLDHTFTDVQTATSAATDWNKRIYFIDERHVDYKPIRGHDMKSRAPDREHDSYVWYWGLTHKFALCMNKRRVHSVMAIV